MDGEVAMWVLCGCCLVMSGLSVWLALWVRMLQDERDAARRETEAFRHAHAEDRRSVTGLVERLDRVYAAMRDYVPQDFDPEDE